MVILASKQKFARLVCPSAQNRIFEFVDVAVFEYFYFAFGKSE